VTARSELIVGRATFTEEARKGVINEAIQEMMRMIRLLFMVSVMRKLLPNDNHFPIFPPSFFSPSTAKAKAKMDVC